MKKYYFTTLILLLITNIFYCQNYEFGIVHISGNSFKVVAIPDFNSFDTNTESEVVDVSDVGFTLMLPNDPSEIQNVTTLFVGRTWNLNSYDAAFLSSQGLGNGTKDAFLLTMNPGQTIIGHVSNVQLDLVSFDVVNPPSSGEIYFLENNDPIALGAGNVLDSFFNADIDGPGTGSGTTDYFGGNDPSLNSFSFGTLSISENSISGIKIYPNPVSDILYIQNENVAVSRMELYNLQGKCVLNITDNVNQINVENLNKGIYFLKIFSVIGETNKKIIIE
jgi:hypothetical protein